jgi:hypothetical protein
MTQFDDIIVTPNYGPLSTGNYPGIIPISNLGILNGVHPNPPQFYPSDGASGFSNSRHQYYRTTGGKNNNPNNLLLYNTCSGPYIGSIINKYSCGQNPIESQEALVYAKKKRISPQCSSLFTSSKRSNAVGQSSYKIGLSNEAFLGYKNYNKNDVKEALQYTRAGGCTAPKKKGSIYNTSLKNGQVCSWGSVVRQNY